MKRPLRKIAFIPARKGSSRIQDKNIQTIGGRPLIAYAVVAALDSGCFDRVVCSSDDRDYLDIAEAYGAETIIRQFKYSEDLDGDLGWVKQALDDAEKHHGKFDIFAIVRPTAPFRTSDTIIRAMSWFMKKQPCDSIRAMERVKQHPFKMWQQLSSLVSVNSERVVATLGFKESHNLPYQALPTFYIQNASMEVAWVETIRVHNSISGQTVKPFFTNDLEGFDINTELDLTIARLLHKKGGAKCQKI
jgi:CMP-N-acetylneuraminic acid synthetase